VGRLQPGTDGPGRLFVPAARRLTVPWRPGGSSEGPRDRRPSTPLPPVLMERSREVVARALEAGVARMVCWHRPDSSRRSARAGRVVPRRVRHGGMHPHTPRRSTGRRRRDRELLAERWWWGGRDRPGLRPELSPVEDQQLAFRTTIALSRESRGSPWWSTSGRLGRRVRILAEGRPTVVLHCFSGTVEVAQRGGPARVLPFLCGELTYPNAPHLRRPRRGARGPPLDRDRQPVPLLSRCADSRTARTLLAVVRSLVRGARCGPPAMVEYGPRHRPPTRFPVPPVEAPPLDRPLEPRIRMDSCT